MTIDQSAPVAELPDDAPEGVADFLSDLAELAAANIGQQRPVAAGTFALYPMPDGGLMFVVDVAEGPMKGIQRRRMPPAMIRAAALLAGGDRIGAVKAMAGIGKRKARNGR
jgi:hypothetical protein